jgi:hypothetical protein
MQYIYTMFIFDYLTFLDYYSNHKNLQKDFIGIGPLYYFVNKNKPAKMVNLLEDYILVDGIKIYVKIHPNKRHPERVPAVLFTIPTFINNVLYDVHYHFGENSENNTVSSKVTETNIRKNKKTTTRKYTEKIKNKKIKHNSVKNTNNKIKILDNQQLPDDSIQTIYPVEEIYFHKTVQTPTESDFLLGQSLHIPCKFYNGTQIDDVYKIICTHEKNEHHNNLRTMETTFSATDLKQIREIISRPFRHQKKGGKKTRKKYNVSLL